VFPRPDDQNAAEPFPAERVRPRSRAVHATHHLQLLTKPAQQDLRHDPVLAEPDSILASSFMHQCVESMDRHRVGQKFTLPKYITVSDNQCIFVILS